MTQEFIPYEQSVLLKELGFDEPCFAYYKDGKITGVDKWDREDWGFHVITNKEVTSVTSEIVIAPTYSQAFRWFREKYSLVIQYIPYEIDDSEGQSIIHHKYKISEYDSWRGGRRNTVETELNEDYEEAELACLKKLIEIAQTH
jgi:hypothetical protein